MTRIKLHLSNISWNFGEFIVNKRSINRLAISEFTEKFTEFVEVKKTLLMRTSIIQNNNRVTIDLSVHSR